MSRLARELIGSSLEARGLKAGSSPVPGALLCHPDFQHVRLCARCVFEYNHKK